MHPYMQQYAAGYLYTHPVRPALAAGRAGVHDGARAHGAVAEATLVRVAVAPGEPHLHLPRRRRRRRRRRRQYSRHVFFAAVEGLGGWQV